MVAKRGETNSGHLKGVAKPEPHWLGLWLFEGEAMKVVIEKGIPMPSAKQGVDKFKLKEMEIGDSFHLELEPEKEKSLRNKINLCAKRTGVKISIRKTEKGIRVWRTE